MKPKIPRLLQKTLLITLLISFAFCGHYYFPLYKDIDFKNSDLRREEREYIPFEVPKLYLDFFSGEYKNVLIDYLIRSPKWHVFPLQKTIVAVKRDSSTSCYPVMEVIPSSYSSVVIPSLQNNSINFAPYYKILEDSNFPINKTIENARILLDIKKKYHLDNPSVPISPFRSSLTIESKSKNISLYTHEISDDKQRNFTKKYLISISNEFKKLADSISLNNKNFMDSILPQNFSRPYSQNVVMIKLIKAGNYTKYSVSGFVNPGKKGFIYLKLIDKTSGQSFPSDQEGTNAEYTGWSTNPNEKFNFCLGKSGPRWARERANSMLLEFQLWFKTSDDNSEELLYSEILSANASDQVVLGE
jgi:hypothetical protein